MKKLSVLDLVSGYRLFSMLCGKVVPEACGKNINTFIYDCPKNYSKFRSFFLSLQSNDRRMISRAFLINTAYSLLRTLTFCGRQNNASHPWVSHTRYHQEPVHMLPYMAKELYRCDSVRDLRQGDYPELSRHIFKMSP